MELFNDWASSAAVEALGWTVLHSFWQGALLALGLGLAQFFLRKSSANARYWMGMSILGLLLLVSLGTFVWAYQWRLHRPMIEWQFGVLLLEGEGRRSINWWILFSDYFDQHIPLIVSVWMLGVLFFLLRSLGGLAYVQHLKTRYIQAVDHSLYQRMEVLAGKIGLTQSIQLAESALVRVPMVIGYFKPMILLPAGALISLSPQQLEAVLVHELAHIRRNDYLLNIFQTFVEVVYYFNPSVWWLSSFIRNERENCCDDLAIQVCGNSLDYAKALVQLQELASAAPAMAVAAAGKKKQMLKRIRRILNQPKSSSNIMEKLLITTLLLLIFLGFSFATSPFAEDALFVEEMYEEFWEATPEPDLAELIEVPPLDTMPKPKSRFHVIKEENGQKVEILVEQGAVKRLKIDGEEIPASDFEQYEAMMEELVAEAKRVPAPPAPPTPPVAPTPPVVPASPTAPTAPTAPLPPTPPLPPAAPTAPSAPAAPDWGLFNQRQTIRVSMEESEEGNFMVQVLPEGLDDIQIELIEADGSILVDGHEIANLEELILVKENPDAWVPAYGQQARFFSATEPIDLEVIEPAVFQIRFEGEPWEPWVEISAEAKQQQAEWQAQIEYLHQQASDLDRQAQEAAFQSNADLLKAIQQEKAALHRELAQFEQEIAREHQAITSNFAHLSAPHPQRFLFVQEHTEQDEIMKILKNELQRDGLIQGKHFSFELNSKRLKINGKKQPEHIFLKYQELCESMLDQRKANPLHLSVTHKNNKSSVSISH